MRVKVLFLFCKVYFDLEEEEVWLCNLLKVDVPGAKYTKLYRCKKWDGKKRFYDWSTKSFAIGFLCYVLAKNVLYKICIEDTRHYISYDNVIPELTVLLRDYQEKAFLLCLQNKNCIVSMATNAGKTLIFSALIKKLCYENILILIHREEILKQIKEMITIYTGLNIGIITSKCINIERCTIAMTATLLNRIGTNQEVTDYFQKVSCIIVDEVHHSKSRSISSILSASNAIWRFGFSGTVPEENTYDGMLVRQWIGTEVIQISNNDLIKQKISAQPKVYLYEIDSKDKMYGIFNEAKEKLCRVQENVSSRDLIHEVYRLSIFRGVVENEERNNKVIEILHREGNKSVLIVVDLIQHGKIVQELLQKNNINAEFISGKSENRNSAFKNFKEGKLNVLLSTSLIDEGVNIERINVLIMLAGKKSRRQILQRIGRSLRKKQENNIVHIYDFIDYGSKYLERHSKFRMQIYKKEGFELEFR